ncbi:MAG: hypothetical protein RL341_973 [Pseudomonadota bacterium]|jgi:hypothetical protein
MNCARFALPAPASARLFRVFVHLGGHAWVNSAAPSKRSNRSKAFMEVFSL